MSDGIPAITDGALAEIEKRARLATPGPWCLGKVEEGATGFTVCGSGRVDGDDAMDPSLVIAQVYTVKNLAHVILSDPTTILAMAARLRAAESALLEERRSRDAKERILRSAIRPSGSPPLPGATDGASAAAQQPDGG